MLKPAFPFKPPIIAGSQWALLLFALGFILGTLRVLVTAPALGDWTATLVELPVMLWAGWLSCARLAKYQAVGTDTGARLLMGLAFLVLLLGAEQALGLWGFGRTLAQQGAAMQTPPALAGLAAQLITAAFPLLQGWHAR
jgi:hypothetical protein